MKSYRLEDHYRTTLNMTEKAVAAVRLRTIECKAIFIGNAEGNQASGGGGTLSLTQANCSNMSLQSHTQMESFPSTTLCLPVAPFPRTTLAGKGLERHRLASNTPSRWMPPTATAA